MPANNVLEVAAEAARAGIVVLPVREDGSKRPALDSWTQYQERQPTKEELKAWFMREERHGLGFVCGKVSGGLELLEFDEPGAVIGFKGAAVEAGLWDVVKRLELGYSESTPGGGVHWLFRTDSPLGNLKLAAKPCPGAPDCDKHQAGKPHVLIETRGEGGFVVVAPSHGAVHASGKPYTLYGGGVGTIPTLTTEERDQLYALAQLFDEMPRQVERGPQPRIRTDAPVSERPGDDYNRRAEWSAILEPHGWEFVRRMGALSYWRRPGKQGGAHSATTGIRGGDATADYLYVFTSSTEFDAERAYSKFAAYAILSYGSDDAAFSAASRDLRAQGYGGIYDETAGLIAGALQTSGDGSAGERPAAAPAISPSLVEPPRKAGALRDEHYAFESVFPMGHFVRRYIDYASKLTDAAHEYHEALAVALLAACTPGLRAHLSAWPSGLSTNLYMVIVGSSTRSRKSTAIARMKSVLRQVDEAAVFPDRFSSEAMLEQLAMRPRRPAVWFPDEWGQVIEALPRDPKLQDALLSLYDSPRSYDYARHSKRQKGGEKLEDHDRIVDPHWNVIGATTEAVFDAISSRAVQSGFLPRFAYIYPDTLPPRMGLQLSVPGSQDAERELVEYLRELHSWSEVAYDQSIVQLTQEAADIVDAYMLEVEEADETMLARLPPMAIKAAMLCAAGREVPGGIILEVTTDDVRAGVALARRWGSYATRFSNDIGGFDAMERRFMGRCTKALAYVREAGRRSRAEVMGKLRVSADELDRIQRTLLEQGSIVLAQGTTTGGRPPIFWEIGHRQER